MSTLPTAQACKSPAALRLAAATLLLSATALACTTPATKRTVTVAVQGDPGPLAGIKVRGIARRAGAEASGTTGDDGTVSLAFELDSSAETIWLFPVGSTQSGVTPAQFRSRNAFAAWTPCPLSAGDSGANATIRIEPAIRYQTSVTRNGTPTASAMFLCRRPSGSKCSERLGWFGVSTPGHATEIGGVPLNTSVVLYVVSDNAGGRVVTLNIPPHAADTDLPDLQIPDPPAPDCEIEVTVVRASATLNRAVEPCGSGLTLVSADGKTILSYILQGSPARAVQDAKSLSNPRIPAGTWYLVPGLFMATQVQLRTVDLIQSGADLTVRALPKIEAVAGRKVTFQVDAAAAERAILDLPTDP